jgi:hypothetical protein
MYTQVSFVAMHGHIPSKSLSTRVDFGSLEWIECFECVLECLALLLQ